MYSDTTVATETKSLKKHCSQLFSRFKLIFSPISGWAFKLMVVDAVNVDDVVDVVVDVVDGCATSHTRPTCLAFFSSDHNGLISSKNGASSLIRIYEVCLQGHLTDHISLRPSERHLTSRPKDWTENFVPRASSASKFQSKISHCNSFCNLFINRRIWEKIVPFVNFRLWVTWSCF